MKKTNFKSNILGLKILSILVFSLLIIPLQASARTSENYGTNYSFSSGNSNLASTSIQVNPRPVVTSISPNSANRGSNGTVVTISGSGFVPSSVARVNGSNRSTTFIDYSHLMIQLNGNDMYRTDGGFFITVYNNNPGGGFSNSAFFTIKNTVASNDSNYNNYNNNSYSDNYNSNRNTSNYSNYNNYDNYSNTNGQTNGNEMNSYSDLAANVVYGSNSFLPSGLTQWILFAIIILLIVIFARRVFGAREKYHATPLKHE